MAKRDKSAIITDPKNLVELSKEYFKAKYRLGNSEDVKPHMVRELRKHIARVKTKMSAEKAENK